ncbi:MAG: hydantoinase/oxoprolinase family protein, partial [Dehalococcoidia bacterium]|nr:hydantoinase/oxoprolinase family protein [Dehalococcoidia bacterium]
MGKSRNDLLKQVKVFGHGTTVATNTLITRTGSKTGFLTTKGHEDTLLIGRIHQKVAGLNESELTNIGELDKAVPLVPRSLIKGITERVDYKGDILVKLDEGEVKQVVADLVARGVKAIGVNLLWSFMNPAHELKIKSIITEQYPNIFVSISSELAPVIKEYERGATTALNAYLGVRTSTYISALEKKLSDNGLKYPLQIMQSMGGFMSAREACVKPVTTLASGPVGGAIASRILAAEAGYENVITSDVGGTSFDVGLVIKGQTEFSNPVFDKYRISIPMVDITSVGAGGGSIAWVEEGTGIMKVGPQSAGADPGPVCYDLGGLEPTVTDADFVLGRYNPEYFLGGTMKIDRDKSLAAIEEKIARPIGMDVYKAAMGILDIVDSHMADLIRKVTVGRGYDPREFVLFAFGGGGPGHVGAYGPDVGVKLSVIPQLASVFSAFGIAASDIVHVKELSDPMSAPGDEERLTSIFQKLEKEIQDDFNNEGVPLETTTLVRTIDMRYKGQVHELRNDVGRDKFTSGS